MAKILLLDDDEQIRKAVELQLKKDGYETVAFGNGQDGLDRLASGEFDLIVTDLQMPKVTGIELLERIRQDGLMIPAIVLTGFGSIETAVEAMKLGASDYITKPPQLAEISLKVKNILERQELTRENQRLKKELEEKFGFEEIVGKSPAMIEMFERLRPLSNDANISILLVGESGTGKELTAKSIHYNSPRAEKPFVEINCGALPEHLLESELFGHEKGAFTDAKEQKKGLFEMANGGTLFLDEISTMPLAMQVKLLRAIEEREIRRVGGTKDISLDVRFIAASNQDVGKLIEEGKFREDLYYRLAVATVKIPLLRDRFGDVGLLVHHFLERFGAAKGRKVEIDKEALEVLEGYFWKGNVRELENLVELLVVTSSERITKSDLPKNILEAGIEGHYVYSDSESLKTITKRVTEKVEREFISEKLQKNRWNVSKTAEAIGISRGALHVKIKELGIEK